MTNTITFKLSGVKEIDDFHDVELDKLSVNEALALKNVLESFISIANLYNDKDAIIQIEKGSALTRFAPSTADSYLKIVKDMDDVVNNKCVNKSIINEYNKIQKVCSNKNYQLTIERTDENAKIINLNKYFTRKKPFYKKRAKKSKTKIELVFISGELFDLGGKKINAHITNKKGDAVLIDIDRKEDARKLGNYLYSEAFISALKFQSETVVRWKFIDSYIDKSEHEKFENFVKSLKALELVERYEKVYDLAYEVLGGNGTIETKLKNLIKYFKLLVNENSDKGMLMTIMLALSQFQENKIVIDLYRRTNDIYNRKNN